MGRLAVKCILCVFLAASIAGVIYHQVYIDTHGHYFPSSLLTHKLIPHFFPNLLAMVFLMLTYALHVLLKNYDIVTPTSAFIVLVGFLWGILCSHNNVVRLGSMFMLYPPEEVLFMYTAVLMFNIAFCLDVPIFLKTLPQSVVIGIPVFFATGITFGFMAREIINPGWTSLNAAIFGILNAPIYPKSITLLLKQHSTKTKQIAVLLEAEALFSVISADVARELANGYLSGMQGQYYHFLSTLARFLLLGGLSGYLFGLLGQYLLRKMYTDQVAAMVICFALPFAVYSISSKYLGGLGSIPVAITGAMLGMERTILAKQTETFLIDFWETAAFILDAFISLRCAVLCGTFVTDGLAAMDYCLVVAAFFVYFVVRFLCFLVFSGVISRLGYGMDLRGMLVCAWSGLKNPFSLESINVLEDAALHVDVAEQFFFYILGIYFLSHLINGSFTSTLLEALDLTRISSARQINMNNCMTHLFKKRETTVHVLKQDRFLADVNWPVVIEATNVKHPYRMQMDDVEDEEFFLGYRFTYCSDCKKDVPIEPTPKEFKEMTREAKMRVLKAKKMSYSRQYENGMMSKEGIRILNQAVELAADSPNAEIKVEDLYGRFTNENCFQRFVRQRAEALRNKKTRFKPPRTYWRRICYHWVVTRRTFARVMLLVVVLHCAMILTDFYYNSNVFTQHEPKDIPDEADYCLLAAKIVFTLLYLVEFAIKIMALSYIHVCADGFRTYFKSVWNIIDFVVLIGCFLNVHHTATNLLAGKDDDLDDRYCQAVDVLCLLRGLRLLLIFHIFYPDIISYLDEAAESRLAFTYELGKSYATTETEILDMLPYMIDNAKIRADIGAKMERDRAYVTKLLGLVQKEKPWIAITVKTKQAIRTILNGKKEAIESLKTSGWIDLYEYAMLTSSMEGLYKRVNSIQKVQPSPPKVIFKEVAWMAEDDAVIDFLFENVTVKSFEPGQVVFTDGNVADGIYIVVTGLFMINYKPDPNILAALNDYGRLPVVDYLSGTKYEEGFVDYIVSGNCIGELSTLTGRCYNCTITADAHSQVYVLSRGVLRRAMELSPDPAIGLECRIWKEVSVRIALPLLLSIPAYQAFSQDQIKFALERAFVPNLSEFKIFTVTDIIEDIILIEGVVSDFNTRALFFAPRYIPRTVQKLILPTSSLMDIPIDTETKILIIPAKHVDEIDVMVIAEETCEMKESASASRCLQHVAQQQIRKKRRRRHDLMGSGSRGRQLAQLMSTLESSASRFTGMESTKSTTASYKNEKSEVGSVYIPADSSNGRAMGQEEQEEAPPPPPPQRGRRVSLYFN